MVQPDVTHIAVPNRERREGSAALNIPGTGTQYLDACPPIVEKSLAGISGTLDDQFDRSDQHVIIDENLSDGVPGNYTKTTQNSDQFIISPGNLNKLRLRSQINNEHVESSREQLGIVSSGVVIGQIFRASQPNINGISLTLESAAAFTSMDDITVDTGSSEQKAGTMEYSSTAEMLEEYISDGPNDVSRAAYTDIEGTSQDGNWACSMPLTSTTDQWRVALTPTDLSNVTFSLKYAQSDLPALAELFFVIGDGTNTKSFPLDVNNTDVWQTFEFLETAMSVTANDDTASAPAMTGISEMGFRVDDSHPNAIGYADSISYQVQPGSINLELWDMGASLPTGNGTVDYTTGTQYTELGDRGIGGVVVSGVNFPLIGGKRKYHIDSFIAGPALEIPDNTILTTGNYYSLVLKYEDTNVAVFGANTAYGIDYYKNGYAWSASTGDNLIDRIPGASGNGAYSDIMFQIFSSQDVYIKHAHLIAPSAPGDDATVSVFVEDENMTITDVIISEQQGGLGRTEIDKDLSDRPVFMGVGGKYEAYYNDDPSDDIDKVLFLMDYFFVPPTVNG